LHATRHSLRFTVSALLALSAGFFSPVFGAPDCSSAVLRLMENYRALADESQNADGDLITALEDAIIVSPDCAPALTAAAVTVLDGEDDLIRESIQAALEIIPTQAHAILAAAKEVSHTSVEAIASMEEAAIPPAQLRPVSGGEPQTAAPASMPLPPLAFPGRNLDEIGSSLADPEAVASPFEFSLSLGSGFDSNPGTSPSEVESGYLRAGLGAKIDRTLRQGSLKAHAGYTMLDYFRRVPNFLENNHLGNVGFTFERGFGSRWNFLDQAEFRRDINPDFDGGLTTSLREQAYHTLSNRMAVAFDVNPLWQMRGGYTLTGIDYQGDSAARSEERIGHAIGVESRYQFLGVAVFSTSYEAEFVDFRHSPLDYTRHETLAGISTSLGERLAASLAGGAQFRRGGSGGDQTTPAAEGSLDWDSESAADIRWTHRYGQFDQELALLGFDQREGYQTRLIINQPLGDRLSLQASAGALVTEFERASDSLDETALTASLGLTWELMGDFELNAGYHFVQLDSPLENRDYVRHQVDVGVSRQF